MILPPRPIIKQYNTKVKLIQTEHCILSEIEYNINKFIKTIRPGDIIHIKYHLSDGFVSIMYRVEIVREPPVQENIYIL